MSWAEIMILGSTVGYFGATVMYLWEGSVTKAAIFGMYGLCNVLIAVGTR